MKTVRTMMIALIAILALGMIAGMATAGTPPIPPTPTPVPQSQPSGGYSPPPPPPVFQPYTDALKSSDGSTVGQLAGIDFSTVRLTASGNAIVDGDKLALDIMADLSSSPAGATLDIKMSSDGNLPGGMDNVAVLSAASITARSNYGWSIKQGSMTFTFTMPASRITKANQDTKFYLVRNDGTNYQIITVNAVNDNGITTIEAKVPDLSGTYTVVMSCPPVPVVAQSSTPSPTELPAPTPVASPEPASTGWAGWLQSIWFSAFGTFAIGEVMGAMILLVMGRFVK